MKRHQDSDICKSLRTNRVNFVADVIVAVIGNNELPPAADVAADDDNQRFDDEPAADADVDFVEDEEQLQPADDVVDPYGDELSDEEEEELNQIDDEQVAPAVDANNASQLDVVFVDDDDDD